MKWEDNTKLQDYGDVIVVSPDHYILLPSDFYVEESKNTFFWLQWAGGGGGHDLGAECLLSSPCWTCDFHCEVYRALWSSTWHREALKLVLWPGLWAAEMSRPRCFCESFACHGLELNLDSSLHWDFKMCVALVWPSLCCVRGQKGQRLLRAEATNADVALASLFFGECCKLSSFTANCPDIPSPPETPAGPRLMWGQRTKLTFQ